MNKATWAQREKAAWERYMRASEAFKLAGTVEAAAREAWVDLYREAEAEAAQERITSTATVPARYSES